jgi:beta-glucosidase-like glycosyl hydrolase
VRELTSEKWPEREAEKRQSFFFFSPGAMAQAAIGDLGVTRAIGLACGRELKLVGINWTYSPVADVNINPLNPVIGKSRILVRRDFN